MAKLAGQRCKSQHGRLRGNRAAKLAVWWHLLCRDCYRSHCGGQEPTGASHHGYRLMHFHAPSSAIHQVLWSVVSEGDISKKELPWCFTDSSVVSYFSIKAIFLNCENILVHGIQHSHNLLVTELELINDYSVGTKEPGQNVDKWYVGSTNPDKIIQSFFPQPTTT